MQRGSDRRTKKGPLRMKRPSHELHIPDHYCPNVSIVVRCRLLHFRKLSPMYLVIDLNLEQVKSMLPRVLRKELLDECWPIDLFTTGGLSSYVRVPPMRCALQGRLQTQEFLLLGPVSLHGLRPANVPRKLARHRSLSAGQPNQALSHGHSRSRLAQHAGQRQLGTGLAHLRRLRALADPPSTSALSRRRFQSGVRADCLRARFHHHRPLPLVVSLGLLSQTKGGRETAYLARPAGQHSHGNHHYSRPNSRGQYSRSAHFRSRCFLSNGSGLSRLSPPASPPFGFGLFRHARPQTIRLSAPLLRAGRQNHRHHVRSDRHLDQSSSPRWLPRQTPSHSLFRSPTRKTADLSYQQLYPAASDRCAPLSQSLAGGAVLQMDQAAPANQKVLRYFSERPENSNLDRHLDLRARGDCQKAIEARRQPLQNSTDLERLALRENSDFRSSFIIRLRYPANQCWQTTDLVPLTLGQ